MKKKMKKMMKREMKGSEKEGNGMDKKQHMRVCVVIYIFISWGCRFSCFGQICPRQFSFITQKSIVYFIFACM